MTLGTHEQPFDRLLDLLTTLSSGRDVVVQHGTTAPRPRLASVTWLDYAPIEEISAHMAAADAVISHAGVGSIMTAIRNRKKPVAVPRLARFGEHVDDHQLQIAARFSAAGIAFQCLPGDALEPLLAAAARAEPPAMTGASDLGRAVASAARGLDRPPPRSRLRRLAGRSGRSR